MSISEKIKAIDNKIKQNKGQYDLEKQTARISALSSRNVSKHEILTGKDVLPENDVLEKAATMKIFKYSPLGKELKAQTDIANKQHQKLGHTYKFDKIIKKEKPTFKKYNNSNLIYNRISFYSYSNNKEFDSLSQKSKYSYLLSFYDDFQKFIKMKPIKLDKIKEKLRVYNTVSELCNKRFENYLKIIMMNIIKYWMLRKTFLKRI